MAKLGRMHRRQGDALAGRLMTTLEWERVEILAKVDGELGSQNRVRKRDFFSCYPDRYPGLFVTR